jgi:hypothetical protein
MKFLTVFFALCLMALPLEAQRAGGGGFHGGGGGFHGGSSGFHGGSGGVHVTREMAKILTLILQCPLALERLDDLIEFGQES